MLWVLSRKIYLLKTLFLSPTSTKANMRTTSSSSTTSFFFFFLFKSSFKASSRRNGKLQRRQLYEKFFCNQQLQPSHHIRQQKASAIISEYWRRYLHQSTPFILLWVWLKEPFAPRLVLPQEGGLTPEENQEQILCWLHSPCRLGLFRQIANLNPRNWILWVALKS